MKLLFVHDGPIYYDAAGNYYEYSYHNLLERYRYLADDITFLMRTYPIPAGEAYTPVPKEIHVIGVPNFKAPTAYFREIGKVKRTIEAAVRGTDIAILRGSSCSQIAAKYARRYGKPYIYECTGCIWDSLTNYSALGKLMAPGVFLTTRRTIKRADYVDYVTTEFLQRRYPTGGKSLGCSDVVVGHVDEAVLERRKARAAQLNPKSKIRLGTAAALDVRYKGQEYVIAAIRELARRGYDAEYHLAGGNRRNSTFLRDVARREGMEDRVIFEGSLSADEMPAFYDSLDVYIQPSLTEALPRAVVEAMSRGCIALGSNVGGIPELIGSDCLFEKGSAPAIAAALEKLMGMDLPGMCERNFRKAREFEQPVLAARRREFYDGFLRECGRGR